MAIPELQMETWTHRGAIDTAKKTHESIRNALNQSSYYPDGLRFDIYLQGSYKNYTNIRGNSDVDVVAQLNTSFLANTSHLSMNDLIRYKSSVSDASYQWDDFRHDTYLTLVDYYGTRSVSYGKKTIKVETSLLPADVVVSLQHRQYHQFTSSSSTDDYIEGITFYVPSEQRWVINFPKQHYENGNNKQSDTSEWFKPTVRLYKNMRNRLLDLGRLADDVASSYYIECLLYNVPSDLYGGTFQQTFVYSHIYLSRSTDVQLSTFMCQNGITHLFGFEPETWQIAKARHFLEALWWLWSNWE